MEIHRADPAARRKALLGLCATLLLGAALIWWLQGWLARLPASPDVLDRLLWSAFGAALATCAVALAAAGLLWRIARLGRAEARFPPASLLTVRDVPVRRGDAALRAARACEVAAAAIALLGLAALGWMAWVSAALAG